MLTFSIGLSRITVVDVLLEVSGVDFELDGDDGVDFAIGLSIRLILLPPDVLDVPWKRMNRKQIFKQWRSNFILRKALRNEKSA